MYRDRVEERRKGLNLDYAQTEAMKNVSAEHSKYLGGDIKHTHLVKGLDFALLKKIRDEMKQKINGVSSSRSSSSSSAGDVVRKEKLARELVFNTHKASSLYRELTRSRKSRIKTFMTGQTSIVFHLNLSNGNDTDGEVEREEMPPTLVSHGKRVDSTTQEDGTVFCTVSDKLLDQIKQARSNSSSRKKRRLEKTSYLSGVQDGMGDGDDDFEIFPGMGKYQTSL